MVVILLPCMTLWNRACELLQLKNGFGFNGGGGLYLGASTKHQYSPEHREGHMDEGRSEQAQ